MKKMTRQYCDLNFMASMFLCLLVFLSSTQLQGQQFTKVSTGAPATDVAASRSVNWIDYDGDGNLDLFVTRGKAGGQNNMMYHNNGAPTYQFTKMDTMIVSRDGKPSDGSSWGDADNDGDPDLFVVNWYNQNNMFYTNTRGVFTQVTSGPLVTNGGYSETCTWGDYNNDGLLDLYVTNSAGISKNFLYKNLGGNQFQKILDGAIVNDQNSSRGANWVDYDNDGDLDLFVCNESDQNENLYKNMLKETGVDTFQTVTTGPLVNSNGSSWSGSWGDYDNDGDFDVFVTGWNFGSCKLFQNDGSGNFASMDIDTLTSELGYHATAAWVDYDNDGDLDLFITTAYSPAASTCKLYRNNLIELGSVSFTNISSEALVNEAGNWYGTSWGDYDNDGDLDVYVAGTLNENSTGIMYKNNGNSNHWLTLDCIGTVSNCSAIGTKVHVKALINGHEVWQVHQVEGQSGYCGQTLQQHFGLGDAVQIDSIYIEWSSGNKQVFEHVPGNRHFTIVENDSSALTLAYPSDGSVNTGNVIGLRWHGKFWSTPYHLQVSTDSLFQSDMVVDDSTITDTSKVVEIQTNNSTYYWRVQLSRTMYASRWSSVGNFVNNVSASSIPVLLSPVNGDSNRSIQLSLQWRKATNTSSYHLRVSQDSLFSSLVVDDSSIVDTFKSVGTLLNKMKYYWKVCSQNAGGNSDNSSTWSFRTIVDTPAVTNLLLPLNGNSEISFSTVLIWNKVEDATSYRLQVATDSQFTKIFFDNQNLTDTVRQLDSLQGGTTYYWRVRASNIGGTGAFSVRWKFVTVLSAPTLFTPAHGSHQLVTGNCVWAKVKNAARYVFALSDDSTFLTTVISDTMVVDTVKAYTNLVLGKRYYWRVRATNVSTTSVWSSVSMFDADFNETTLDVSSKWNLISLPFKQTGIRKDSLFPTATSQAFSYTGTGYVASDYLESGKGYWLKFASDQAVNIRGIILNNDTVAVVAGWNLLGSLFHSVAVSSIVSVPGGLVTSQFYDYSNGYTSGDSLYPGKGYWVKTSSNGMLYLNSSLVSSQSSFGKIKIMLKSEVPPLPPEQISDHTTTMPSAYSLEQNFPNPFNPSTVISYSLPVSGMVRLRVYNILGEEVASLVDEVQDAGYKSVTFDASGLTSGLYYYKLVASDFVDVRKLLLVK